MVAGAIFFAISLALNFLLPSQIKTYETGSITAATVPTLLIRCLIACSVILLIQGILSKEKKIYCINAGLFTRVSFRRMKPVVYIAMLLAYAILMPRIGFIIASLLLANGILAYFGTRKRLFYLIASANVFLAYFAFRSINVILP